MVVTGETYQPKAEKPKKNNIKNAVLPQENSVLPVDSPSY